MDPVLARNLVIRGVGFAVAAAAGSAFWYFGYPIAAIAVVLAAFVLSKVLLVLTLRKRQ